MTNKKKQAIATLDTKKRLITTQYTGLERTPPRGGFLTFVVEDGWSLLSKTCAPPCTTSPIVPTTKRSIPTIGNRKLKRKWNTPPSPTTTDDYYSCENPHDHDDRA